MAHFLKPLLSAKAASVLVNSRTGGVVASALELATDSSSRNKGLLGREGLQEGAALVLAPCSTVHTFFMRFSIDVLFAGRDGRVLKIVRGVPPWRLAARLGAFAVLEFQSGWLDSVDIQEGDFLLLKS